MNANEIILIYTTFPDSATAEKVCRKLLEEKLIACANFIPQMQTLFRWEEQLTSSQEALAILKTYRGLYPELEARIKQEHPYTCPCILAFNPILGNLDYLKWIKRETR